MRGFLSGDDGASERDPREETGDRPIPVDGCKAGDADHAERREPRAAQKAFAVAGSNVAESGSTGMSLCASATT
jgi:hypothetical protein